MSVCVIEINDCALTATLRERGTVVASPGYAIVDANNVIVGEDAYARARLTPRGSHNRYWDQLGMDPLPRSGGAARTQADLAYAHLHHVWQRLDGAANAVVLAVPGTLDRNQLGLLLGIAQECHVPVIGMVDAAVAAARPVETGGDLAVLDVQLHRCVITHLDIDSELTRRSVDDVGQSGLIALYDAWANAISDAFVHATRFDPLHLAETEQALYDALPDWLARLQQEPRAVIELEARHKTHATAIERRQLLAASDRIYRQISQTLHGGRRSGAPIGVQLTARAAALPGLLEHLAGLSGAQIVELPPDAVAAGVFSRLPAIRTADGTAVGYLTRLPWPRGSEWAAESARSSRPAAAPPTHVLQAGCAYALGEGEFLIGSGNQAYLHIAAPGVLPRHCRLRFDGGRLLVEDLSDGATYVNGIRIEGYTIGRVGDSIRVGDETELTLIRVMDEHGA